MSLFLRDAVSCLEELGSADEQSLCFIGALAEFGFLHTLDHFEGFKDLETGVCVLSVHRRYLRVSENGVFSQEWYDTQTGELLGIVGCGGILAPTSRAEDAAASDPPKPTQVDDLMKTYGSSGAPLEAAASPRFHRPELLFHDRDFTYPNNTVEPTTGVPATAAGWRRAVESRKRFFFDQPGWIVVFNCVRPKVYLGKQQGAVAGAMQSQSDWLPAVLNNHHDIGHKQFTDPGVGGTGPLANVMTANYYLDIRDLLNYGDQFINYATPASGATGVPFVPLPASTAQRRYPSATDVMSFFSDTTNGRFRQDGMLSFSIKTYNKEPPNQLLTLGHSTV